MNYQEKLNQLPGASGAKIHTNPQPNRINRKHYSNGKRNDLQGIRGIAILAVLGFHFYPKLFPNGYLGVDQFFVLSGFLMTMIFGSKSINVSSIVEFYYRRVKRIIPLYAFVIFAVLLCVLLWFPSLFMEVNAASSLRAISFTSNIITKSAEHDYFIMLEQAEDVFTHTWSLAVEIQFYLFVPLVFGIYQYLCSKNLILGAHAFLGFLALGSLAYHFLAPSNESFNSMFARYWQFYVGIETFFLTKLLLREEKSNVESSENGVNLESESFLSNDFDEERGISENAYARNRLGKSIINTNNYVNHLQYGFFLALLCVIAFTPMSFVPSQARILSTTSTGFIILCGTTYRAKNILCNRILVLIGDISYSLYLIHWPIVVWIRFNYPESKFAPLIGILTSIILAYIIYRTYETWYLSLGKLKIAILIVPLYSLIIVLTINSENIEKLFETKNAIINAYNNTTFSKEDAIKQNKFWSNGKSEADFMWVKGCFPNKSKIGFCSFPDNPKGKYRMLVIGNSYSINFAGLIHEYFGPHARNFSKFSRSGCEVLVLNKYDEGCGKIFPAYLEAAKKFKPDFLFIVAKSIFFKRPIDQNIPSITEDSIYKEAYSSLLNYINITTKRIYIVGTIPVATKRFLTTLTYNLQNNITTKSSDFVENTDYLNGIKRTEALVKNCPKCTHLPFGDPFFAKKPYGDPQFFSTSSFLGYFFDGLHITPAGLEVIRPVLENEIKRFRKQFWK